MSNRIGLNLANEDSILYHGWISENLLAIGPQRENVLVVDGRSNEIIRNLGSGNIGSYFMCVDLNVVTIIKSIGTHCYCLNSEIEGTDQIQFSEETISMELFKPLEYRNFSIPNNNNALFIQSESGDITCLKKSAGKKNVTYFNN